MRFSRFSTTGTAIIGAALGLLIALPAGEAQAQYMKGKTVSIIVPASAGGGLTRNARRFAQFFENHIPGKPNVIVKNIVGGGGQKGINFVYAKGKKDGTTLMWGPLNLAGIVTGLPGIRYVPSKFTVIGAAGGTPFVTIAAADLAPGIKVPADILKAKNFVSGGRIVGGALGLYSIMGFEILGLDYRHVTGYRNQPKLKAALMGKEIKTITTGAPGFFAFYENDLLKKKTATALYYHPSINADTGKPFLVGDLYGKNVKPFVEFYKSAKGKAPSGPKWDAYKWFSTYMTWSNALVGAPGMDKRAAAELRKGYRAAWNDPKTKAAYKKALGSLPIILIGDEMKAVFNNFRKISPTALTALKSAMGMGERKKGGKKKRKK